MIWAEKIGLKPQQWGFWPTKMEVKAAMTMEYNGINLIDIYRINIVIRPQNKGFKQHKFWSNFEKMEVSKHNQDVRCNVDISDWDTYVCAYCIYVYMYIYYTANSWWLGLSLCLSGNGCLNAPIHEHQLLGNWLWHTIGFFRG